MKTTKIAIVSDLHLDCLKAEIASARIDVLNRIQADYLVIAGDVCEMRFYPDFLPRIRPNVKKVIVVKGNHEFYNATLSDDPEYPDNFICLRAGQPYVDGRLAFVGDTLWSYVPVDRMSHIEYYMNDYDLIKDSDDENITCSVTNALHVAQKFGLMQDLRANAEYKKIVVTHHSPSFLGVTPRFAGHSANCAFHSDAIEEFTDFSDVQCPEEIELVVPKLWIHGHTHDTLDYTHNGTRVVCNPWGYSGETRSSQDFNDDVVKYVEVLY